MSRRKSKESCALSEKKMESKPVCVWLTFAEGSREEVEGEADVSVLAGAEPGRRRGEAVPPALPTCNQSPRSKA